jgi:hypothetical protein
MEVGTHLGSLLEHKIRLVHHCFPASCKRLLEAVWVLHNGWRPSRLERGMDSVMANSKEFKTCTWKSVLSTFMARQLLYLLVAPCLAFITA